MQQLILYVKIIFLVILLNDFALSFWDSFPNGSFVSLVGILYLLKKVFFGMALVVLPFSKKNIKPCFLAIFAGIFFYIFTSAVFPSNMVHLEQIRSDYFICILAFCTVLTLNMEKEKIIRILIYASRISLLITAFALVVFVGSNLMFFLSKNYMFFANAIICPVAFLLYGSIVNKNKVDMALTVLGVFLITLGSRGALLSILVLLSLLCYINKAITTRNLLYLLVGLSAFLLIYENLFGDLDIDYSKSRIFSLFGDSTYNVKDEDRFAIWRIITDRVLDNYLLPGGLCADRVYLNEFKGTTAGQMYSHNFFVELFANFGLFGLLLGIYIFYVYIKFLLSRKYSNVSKSFVSVLFSVSLLQLLFSRSLLEEYNLYIFLAFLYLSIKQNKVYVSKSIYNNTHL